MSRFFASLALALALPVGAQAVPIVFTATLDGPSEFPANPSAGTGTATVTLDTGAHTMRVQITFSGLTGTTTASHIHCCVLPTASPPTAGVATTTPTFPGFPLGVQAGTYDQTFDLTMASSFSSAFITANGGTPAGAEAALAAAMAAGMTYVNIHTNTSTGGEIRGFLQPVPEPSTALLLGLGTAGVATLRRRARARRG